jgi:hypothetical protein
MSTISLKKGAPAEITIPEIQKRYRISPKTEDSGHKPQPGINRGQV